MWLALIALVGCADDEVAGALGGGADGAVIAFCTEGETRCLGEVEQICRGGGFVQTPTDNCRGGGGGGGDLCFQAAAARSYLGCSYWPVDLDNAVEVLGVPAGGRCNRSPVHDDIPACHGGGGTAGVCDYGQACPRGFQCQTAPICALDAQRSPFAIVVSNPQAEPVEVVLEDARGNRHAEMVAPGALASLFPQALGFPDLSLDHSGISAKAYHLTSSAPIVAYQFNPLDNVDVFSNDGSLLVPEHAYDGQYLALTLPTLTRRPDTNDYNGYVTVVAVADNTTVEVEPSAAIRAGDQVTALQPGETHRFSLNRFQVLNLEAVADGDLTGTRVRSPDGTPFGVFVGHEATVLPTEQQSCCADHIEEQLFPISTWGSNFAVARTQPRKRETDLLRILAHRDDTRVDFDPAPAQGRCGILRAGASCDVFINGDTRITASNPVLVGHFLQSTDGAAGDPALAFAVPVEQFRTDYTFLVPQEYDAQYISVVAREGAAVQLDGTDIGGQLRPFGELFAGGRFPVRPGQRRLDCPTGCGVLVYGYSQAVSYLFAGGLDLERITVP
ncbi:MAG: IgGFc-binding protein [Myxococcales bacterium]|nr:IgGFc-binding protein [Myxococcales bacterium]MCB9546058.1 IgGFc-binding protein [Myxococcales bacterium]